MFERFAGCRGDVTFRYCPDMGCVVSAKEGLLSSRKLPPERES
jgi:hypothetical protein